MTEAGFDFPDFRRRKHAGEGRILAQPLGVLRCGAKQITNLVNGARKNYLPLGMATEQGSGDLLGGMALISR
jgi:hypothetical protein